MGTEEMEKGSQRGRALTPPPGDVQPVDSEGKAMVGSPVERPEVAVT